MKFRRVGLNALFLKPSLVGGTERYTREITLRLCTVSPDVRWTLFVSREAAHWANDIPANLDIVTLPVTASDRTIRIAAEQLLLPVQIRKAKLDALLNLGGTGPLVCPCPQVTMVHDLQYKFYPEYFTPAERLALNNLTRMAIVRSAFVLAPSEKVRRDIVAVYGTSPKKIVVTPLGVDPSFRPAIPADRIERDALRNAFDLRRPYLLSVAAARPNKGLDTLLDALMLPQNPPEFDTVMIGPAGNALRNILEHPAVTGGRARWLGWVNESFVYPLYRHASAAVVSTRFEGFCMPTIEALASGTPLLATKIEPLQSILDSHALWVPPDSPEALAAGITRIMTDGALRDRLASTGPGIARRYTWERTADLTAAAMEQAVV